MTSITTWLWGTSQLDDAVDKATSELLPSGAEDIALNLEICDQIRSKSVPAKDAMRALKRRLNHKNPNVQILTLALTDVCIKNGGDQFLTEVASREFMDNLVSILKMSTLNLEVKNNILRLIQNWSVAFEAKPSLNYVGQVYKNLKNEGFRFPPQDLVLANSAMVDTQTAPEWIDSEVCLRCRTAFSFTNRKHHCRNCGQVFDQQCSSKMMPLPHFGITQEVRVCDGCYSKISKKSDKADRTHRHSNSLPSSRHRSARELADAELQRAIQLSLQEVGSARDHARPGYVPSQPPASNWQYSEPPIVDHAARPDTKSQVEDEDDADLRAAIEASLREANAPKPSAPIALGTPRLEEPSWQGYSQSYPPTVMPPHPSVPTLPSYDLEPLESDVILTFSQTVEQVQGQGGRDMSRYPAVNELYDKANGLRPKLAMTLDDTGRKEQVLSEMHDKLSQAVKLYDKLLTEQVSQPRWRSPQPAALYQQANTSYSPGFNSLNGYNQWVPQPQVTSPEPTHDAAPRQPQSPQVAYSSAPPVQEYQSPYNTSYAEGSSQQQWYQHQPQYVDQSPPAQYQRHSAPTPAPPTTQYTQAQPQLSSTQQQQYTEPAHPAQYQPYSVPTPALPYTPSAPLPSAPTPHTTPSAPQPQAPIPFIPSHAPSRGHTLSTSTLTRHNTQTHTVSHPPANPNSYLSRHNTVSHAPTHHHQQQHQHQQQHKQQQQQQQYVQQPLPQFPVAPTSAPQVFPMHGTSIPATAPSTERKEALLIDL